MKKIALSFIVIILLFGIGAGAFAAPKKTSKTLKIVKQGFFNEGTSTIYGVLFSDEFMVIMSIPKAKFGLREGVVIRANKGKSILSKKINIVGFSDTFSEKYYPLSVDIYADSDSKKIIDAYKKMDFYNNLKTLKSNAKWVQGYVVYESFVKLEGVTFDDGIHKCKLYLEDK